MKQIIMTMCAASVLLACGNKVPNEKQEQQIETTIVKKADSTREGKYTFMANPYRVTELSFCVGGQVTELYPLPGRFFRKGELMAAIDKRDYEIRNKRAKAVLTLKEADYRRAKALYERDNIAESAYETAKAEYEKAQTDWEETENALRDTKIYAPVDGYVQQTGIEKFDYVKPGETVVTFIDISKLKAEAYVAEDVAAAITDGQDVEIRAYFGQEDKARTPEEVLVTRNTSGNNISYLITAIIKNDDYSLMGGMTGSLHIAYRHSFSSSSSGGETVVVPRTAVCHNGTKETYVWRIENDNTVKRTIVKTSKIVKDGMVIEDGLKPGNIIATTGLNRLSDGEKIDVKKQDKQKER